MAEATDHFERRQVAIGNELLKLTIPFVEAPVIRVGLIVSAEVRIIEFVLVEKLIGRGGLNDTGGERIGNGVCDGPDTARGVGHPTVVTNRSASVQHRIEDVPLLITRRAVGSSMVTVARQDVGGAALQRGSAVAVGSGGAGGVVEKVTRRDGIQVAGDVSILTFTLIGEATVHTRIVDLLRDGLRIG